MKIACAGRVCRSHIRAELHSIATSKQLSKAVPILKPNDARQVRSMRKQVETKTTKAATSLIVDRVDPIPAPDGHSFLGSILDTADNIVSQFRRLLLAGNDVGHAGLLPLLLHGRHIEYIRACAQPTEGENDRLVKEGLCF